MTTATRIRLGGKATCYYDRYKDGPGAEFPIVVDGARAVATIVAFGYATGMAIEVGGRAAWVQADPASPGSNTELFAWMPEGHAAECKGDPACREYLVRDGRWTVA